MSFGLPALLFLAFSQRSFGELVTPTYMVVYLLGGLTAGSLIYMIAWAQGNGPARRAIGMLGAMAPNSAYFGYPMILLTFPDLATSVLAMNMLVENFILIPLCMVFLELARPGKQKAIWRSLIGALWITLKRPFVVALILGMVVSVIGVPVPAPLDSLMTMLATATGALSLFVIGGGLVGLPLGGNSLLASQIAIGKLLLQPAAVAAVAFLVIAFGWPGLSPELRTAAILTSAAPMFSIFPVIAQEYGHEGLASLAQTGAVVASLFTLTAFMVLLL